MDKEMKARIREITAAMRKHGFGKLLNRTIKDKILPSGDEEYDFFLLSSIRETLNDINIENVVFDEKILGVTRNEIYSSLAAQDIHARKYFYPLTSQFECYRQRFTEGDTPVALHISKRVLTLPLYADLELSDVDKICDIIKKV